MLIRPIMPSTRAVMSSGTLRLKRATAMVQRHRINAHSSNEPSCAPQTPEILYSSGNLEFEFCAT